MNASHNYDTVILHEKLMREVTPEMSFRDDNPELWRQNLKSRLGSLLGLDRMPAPAPLNPTSIWKRDTTYGTIEKISFASEPGYDIPAYLCIPHNATPPYTAFICLQGHSTGMHNSIAVAKDDENKSIEIAGDRDFGIGCMKRGIAALCIEQRAFGECEDTRHGDWVSRCHNPSAQAMMIGRTLLGERVYDVDRAIDYLLSRTEFHPGRIGVMGNSGGGTVSMFAGGLLDRLSFVMPSCSFASFKDSIMSINHCICNYVPGLLQLADCAEITALAVPKPMVIVNGKDDNIFPITSARDSFAQLKRIYNAFGAGDKCQHVIGHEGHRFYADPAWTAMTPYMNQV